MKKLSAFGIGAEKHLFVRDLDQHPDPCRVDLLVTSSFWDLVEGDASVVLCTDEDYPRRSELIHCYHSTLSICSAMTGTYVGVGVGAVGDEIPQAYSCCEIDEELPVGTEGCIGPD